MEIVALIHGGEDLETWWWFLAIGGFIGVSVGGVALLIYAGNSWKKLRRRKD